MPRRKVTHRHADCGGPVPVEYFLNKRYGMCVRCGAMGWVDCEEGEGSTVLVELDEEEMQQIRQQYYKQLEPQKLDFDPKPNKILTGR